MNNHGNKPEEIGVTACDHGRYTGMISPSITRKSRVSSLVADSRSCCHPLPKLVENPLSRCGHTHTHTLMEMHTELIAVPHASLRNPNPERSREPPRSLEVFKRRRGQKLKSNTNRQVTAYRARLPQTLKIVAGTLG